VTSVTTIQPGGQGPAEGNDRFRLASPVTATVLGALALVLLAVAIVLSGLDHTQSVLGSGPIIPIVVVYAGVGVVIARRQPRNPIGWILLVAPAGSQLLPADAGSYAQLAYRPGHRLPMGAVALLLEYSWAVVALLLLLVILLFPDGRLPSPRWRPVLWSYLAVIACVAGCTYAAAVTALAAHPVRVDPGGGLAAVDMPSGSSAWLARFDQVSFPVLAAFWVSFVAAQVLSWRRSSGDRRQQLKWLMSGAGALAASQAIIQPVLNFDPGLPDQVRLLLNVLLGLGAAALPACLGIAILRYRLYDIDRIISRTLAYAIVTGLLIGLYAALVLLATQVLSFRTSVAVAASTLAAVALFNPLRRRVQRMVDRRFNRARYDADQTIAAFAARLKDTTDLGAVRNDLATAVYHALEPVHVSVWTSQQD
jgi:hypothetical protein